MILHLNVNIFECFWVLHNKEPVTKLSSTSCRLDIIIDAYRTGPREINFMLLQFHWFKLKSYTKGLYHRKKKSTYSWMIAMVFICSSEVGGCVVIPAQGELSRAQCPVLRSDFSLLQHPWAQALSLFPCPRLHFLCTDGATASNNFPVPNKTRTILLTLGFFNPVTILFQH